MKSNKIVLALVLISNFAFAQKTVRLTSEYGSKNEEIQNLIDFEGVFIEKLIFENDTLNGKYYEINLQEYKDGNFVKNSLLFDASESDFFMIRGNKLSLKFYFKLEEEKLKTLIIGKNFETKRMYFDLNSNTDDYALKDFFGRNSELTLQLTEKGNAILAIITPTVHKDGSSSYCEVAQSDVMPEKLGEHFIIPHYFLITIKFK